jgi:hypothetical protein
MSTNHLVILAFAEGDPSWLQFAHQHVLHVVGTGTMTTIGGILLRRTIHKRRCAGAAPPPTATAPPAEAPADSSHSSWPARLSKAAGLLTGDYLFLRETKDVITSTPAGGQVKLTVSKTGERSLTVTKPPADASPIKMRFEHGYDCSTTSSSQPEPGATARPRRPAPPGRRPAHSCPRRSHGSL